MPASLLRRVTSSCKSRRPCMRGGSLSRSRWYGPAGGEAASQRHAGEGWGWRSEVVHHRAGYGRARWDRCKEVAMNEDVFNASIRKFLKALGVTAQREIEKAVRQALVEGRLKGNETFPARATVTLGGIGLSHEINGENEVG